MTRRERGSVLALVKSLASRPDGVSQAELREHITMASNAPILSNACKAGHIVAAKRPGCGPQRYFITAQNAAEWLAREPEPKPVKAKAEKAKKTATTPKPAAVKVKAPQRTVPTAKQNISFTAGPSKIVPATSGAPVITSKTRVTIVPTPASRFHVPADHRGPFSLAGIGRDVDTGKAWEARA